MNPGIILSLRAAAWLPEEELALRRPNTMALLRRYFRLAHEIGRMPKLLGREVFRSKVSHQAAASFEDSVIFVHDIERCLALLRPFSQVLITKIVFQEYSQDETARMLRRHRNTVWNRFPEAIDELTLVLIDRKLLRVESCQGGKNDKKPVIH